MKTVAIIQARLASTRLPAKVLLPLPTGRTVLEEVVYRCKQIEGVDQVVVAMPCSPQNFILHGFCGGAAVTYATTAESDVLGRYAIAAATMDADRILRVTSDCPLIDPLKCAATLWYCNKGADYARLEAQGWSCEAFTANALYEADRTEQHPSAREHVGPAVSYVAADSVTVDLVPGQTPPPSLDTLDDYIRIWKIFEDQIAADPSLRAA